MRMLQTSRLITGAFKNIQVRGKRPRRKSYQKPGRCRVLSAGEMVLVQMESYYKEAA